MANNNTKRTRRATGVIGKVLIAAAMVSLLTLTASAAELGWFRGFFEKQSDTPLTPEQVEFIDRSEQEINESQTRDGYTLGVKSAITDGRTAHIVIGITGPADAVLSKTVIEGYDPAAPAILLDNWGMEGFLTDAEGRRFVGRSSIDTLEDGDGLDNTQDLLLTFKPDAQAGEIPFAPGRVWKLHMENLKAIYHNEAYMNELMEDKYKGQENFSFTEEEGKRVNPVVTLAQGTWDFELDFADADVRTVELIQQPVATRSIVGWKDGQNEYGQVQIRSFALSALGAVVTIEDETICPDFNDYANSAFVQAVLKDGSRITLDVRSASGGTAELEAKQPIPLDQVDHIEMPDGVQIPMP
ncbi:MAG: DUF4179 domain-containing protein [Eubacteriales bacterium]|nr:DUF4179 domain-containing protein [Eubacteriales bacterium]